MSIVLPANFYDRVREGSLILKKSQSFSFYINGLALHGEDAFSCSAHVGSLSTLMFIELLGDLLVTQLVLTLRPLLETF